MGRKDSVNHDDAIPLPLGPNSSKSFPLGAANVLKASSSGGARPGRARSSDLAGRPTALAPPCLLLCFGNSVGHWGSLQRSPDPYLDFRGPTSKGSEGRGRGEKGKEGGTKRGRKGRQAPPSPSQFATPLGQASPTQRPGLWVTGPGLMIF